MSENSAASALPQVAFVREGSSENGRIPLVRPREADVDDITNLLWSTLAVGSTANTGARASAGSIISAAPADVVEPRWSVLFHSKENWNKLNEDRWDAAIQKLCAEIVREAPDVFSSNHVAGQARVEEELKFFSARRGWTRADGYSLREDFLQDTVETVVRRRDSVILTAQEASPFEAAYRNETDDVRRSLSHSARAISETERSARLVRDALDSSIGGIPAPLAAKKQAYPSLLRDQYSDVFLRRPAAGGGMHLTPIVYLELERLKSVQSESHESILWGQVVPTMLKLCVQYRAAANEDVISYIVVGDMEDSGNITNLHFSDQYTLGWLRERLHAGGRDLPSTAEELADLSDLVEAMKSKSPRGAMKNEMTGMRAARDHTRRSPSVPAAGCLAPVVFTVGTATSDSRLRASCEDGPPALFTPEPSQRTQRRIDFVSPTFGEEARVRRGSTNANSARFVPSATDGDLGAATVLFRLNDG